MRNVAADLNRAAIEISGCQAGITYQIFNFADHAACDPKADIGARVGLGIMRQSDERKLKALEEDYVALLQIALEHCASGQWGLFGHNDRALESLGKEARERYVPEEVRDLLRLGGEIENLRDRLGYAEAFDLHERLKSMRFSTHANTPANPSWRSGGWMSLRDKWLMPAPDRDPKRTVVSDMELHRDQVRCSSSLVGALPRCAPSARTPSPSCS